MAKSPANEGKESRADWVAVEPQFQAASGQPAQPVKPKSAFQFFQKKMMNDVKAELSAQAAERGESLELGSIAKEMSARWQQLGEAEREEFQEMAAQDRARYDEECRLRDEAVESERKRKRDELYGAVEGKRERKKTAAAVAAAALEEEEAMERRSRANTTPRELSARQLEAKRLREEAREQERADKQELRDEERRQKEELAKKRSEIAQARLRYLLSQSDIFAHFGQKDTKKRRGGRRKKEDEETKGNDDEEDDDEEMKDEGDGNKKKTRSKKGKARISEREEDESLLHDKHDVVRLTKQPSVIKFGTMRAYQLEGLSWMINLAHQGINGILADEMGLGKTLQTISVLAYFLEFENISGPHIVMVPKSTLSNWLAEFARWCPSLRTVKFHGNKDERQRVIDEVLCPGLPDKKRKFDVCVTTFEMCMKEKTALCKFAWRYLIIDEAHRIKNEASQFSQVVRMLDTEHRLLLTVEEKIIERAQQKLKLDAMVVQQEEAAKKVGRYENPWEDMPINYQGKGGKVFTEEEDRVLLCLVNKFGYGEWERIKHEICRLDMFAFDYYLHSRTAAEIGRRCDALMRICEKDNADQESKEKKENDVRLQLQAQREDLDRRLADARAELQEHQRRVDEMIMKEAKRMQAQREEKRSTKRKERDEKEEKVDEFEQELADFLLKSTSLDAAKPRKLRSPYVLFSIDKRLEVKASMGPDKLPSLRHGPAPLRSHSALLLSPTEYDTESLEGCIALAIAPRFFLTRRSCVSSPAALPDLYVEHTRANGSSVLRFDDARVANDRDGPIVPGYRRVPVDRVLAHPNDAVNLAILQVEWMPPASSTGLSPIPLIDVDAATFRVQADLALVTADKLFSRLDNTLDSMPSAIQGLVRVPEVSCVVDVDGVQCFGIAAPALRDIPFVFSQGALIWQNTALVGLPDCSGLCGGGAFYSATRLAAFRSWIDAATDHKTRWLTPVQPPQSSAADPQSAPVVVSLLSSAEVTWATEADAACSGALISPSHVLASASCVANRTLHVARIRLRSNGDGDEIRDDLNIKRVDLHPDFLSSRVPGSDLAVISLEAPSLYRPVMLSNDAEQVIDPATATLIDPNDCRPRVSLVDTSLLCMPSVTNSSSALSSSGSSSSAHVVGCDSTSIFASSVSAGASVFASRPTAVSLTARVVLLGIVVAPGPNADVAACNDSIGVVTISSVVTRVGSAPSMAFINAHSRGHSWSQLRRRTGFSLRLTTPSTVATPAPKTGKGSTPTPASVTPAPTPFRGTLLFEKPPVDARLGFVVGLRKSRNGQNFCGGALIAPSFVLTAAHCVQSGDVRFVSVGSRQSAGGDTEEIAVRRANVISHPLYGRRTMFSYDFAVMELESAAYPRPITLDDRLDNITPATYLTLYGYGVNSPTDMRLSPELRSVELPYVPRAQCQINFPELDDSMFCAGGELARDACTGDSGGPLVRVVDGNPVLVGIVSTGRNGCGTPGVPGVYGLVTAAMSFINDHVAGHKWLEDVAARGIDSGKNAATEEGGELSAHRGSPVMRRAATPAPTTASGQRLEPSSSEATRSPSRLSTVEMSGDDGMPLVVADGLMHFLLGNFSNVAAWRPAPQQLNATLYSTGDMTGLLTVISTHANDPLYARKKRFDRPDPHPVGCIAN
ncbi:hypothetical protein P43SY_003193 [Pythium insidiosum]|uniref:Chromatin-remodeling ATPase INO80 n=1 Tax=Pythium insidiosum TaxID=114742 RepID=A0AAD5Q7I8_PYTIN|nr:hypothetical protein P43SY_003193 [Pythium insidiosum]KAJ0400485.1 hypothetical protein ATCC90586_003957 [Pythium insidiosum]